MPGPITGAGRIDAVDTLRGVAVLGILVMNIYAFAMPFAAYDNPLLMGGTEWYNLGTWFVTHVFFDQKFMTIFSMLYGGGLVIMWQRAGPRGAHFGQVFFRRQLWLIVIGAAHAYLLWVGDILFHYAVVGMLVYGVRRWRPQRLIVLGLLMLSVAPFLLWSAAEGIDRLGTKANEIAAIQASGETIDAQQESILDRWQALGSVLTPATGLLQDEVDAYTGDYAGIVEYRAPIVLSLHFEELWLYTLWRVGGLMLLGMALMKLGILAGTRSRRFYRWMALTGYGLGLPMMAISAFALAGHDWDSLYMLRSGLLPNYIGSIPMALGHIAVVMLVARSGAAAKLMARFAAVGRMALTNYLMHSVVMTTIFYGYGLGLYGDIPRAAQMLFVAAMFAVQLWISPVWLEHFRFGPVEWLWRSLTYGAGQPMRRQA